MLHRHHECCAGAVRGVFALPGTHRKYERSLPFALPHVELELEVLIDEQSVRGRATWQFERRSPTESRIALDAVAFDIEQVELRTDAGFEAVPYDYDAETLNIELGDANAGEFRISYRARPERGLYFLSPDDSYPDRPKQVWSQCQDEDARHWFPCHDKPHVKSTATFRITAPETYSVLCNGVLDSSSRDAQARLTTTVYRMTQRLPSYLFTLVVGEFDKIQDRPAQLPSGRSVPIEYWVPKGRIDDGKRGFARTPEMIEHFSELLGVEYPYERYTQVVVSDFIFGGMENTTATTMYEHVLLDERAAIDIDSYDLVAHELAHQWFGDWVTCNDWSQAWLNEGFATYFEHVERERRQNRDEYLLGVERDLETYLSEAGSRYSRPVVCRDYHEPIDLFDRHLYEKGGLVLHALRTSLGDAVFWPAIGRYLVAHAQGSVTTEDLRTSLESESGRSLERFFDEWVYRAGHPSVKVKVSWAGERLTVGFEQQTKHSYELEYEIVVRHADGSERTLLQTSADKHFSFTLHSTSRPQHVVIDPQLRLLGSVRIEAPANMLCDQLRNGHSARARSQAAKLLVGKRDFHRVGLLAQVLSKPKESWLVRAQCARSLGELRSDEALEALKSAVGVAQPKVRAAVANALGRYRTRAAFEALEGMLKQEQSYSVESAIARALGRTRQAAAATLLERELGQASWADIVQSAAADGIAALRDTRLAPLLMQQTQYGRPTRLRRTAAMALARLSDDRPTRQHLEDLLGDRHPHVRADAVAALGVLGGKEARAALERHVERERDGRVVRRAREVLRRLTQGDGDRELKDRLANLERQLNEALGRLTTLESSNQTPPTSSRLGGPEGSRANASSPDTTSAKAGPTSKAKPKKKATRGKQPTSRKPPTKRAQREASTRGTRAAGKGSAPRRPKKPKERKNG